MSAPALRPLGQQGHHLLYHSLSAYAALLAIHPPALSIWQDNRGRERHVVAALQVGRTGNVDPVHCEVAQRLIRDASLGVAATCSLPALQAMAANTEAEDAKTAQKG